MIVQTARDTLALLKVDHIVYNLLRTGIKSEIQQLDIKSSGLSADGIPFIELEDGPIFFGHLPNRKELYLHSQFATTFRRKLDSNCIRVAIEIVTMYKYPHSMPYLTPPFPRWRRYGFHPQHYNTFRDYRIPELQKQQLESIFLVKQNETIVDAGSHIGYGTMRLAKAVGDDGTVVAIEADPRAFKLLEKNVNTNGFKNIRLSNRAAFKEPGSMKFYTGRRQANSLVKKIVNTEDTVDVEANTIPNILAEHGIYHADMISLTINGAEMDALRGLEDWLNSSNPPRISLAGWYTTDQIPIAQLAKQYLEQNNMQVAIGPSNGLVAWH